MSMRSLEVIEDMLCKELDDIAQKGELSAGSLDTVDKITHTMKNIHKIMEDEGGYSQAGNWMARGNSYRSRRSMAYEQEPGRESSPYRDEGYAYRGMR